MIVLQAIMLVEGHMDDGFTFSRAQEEESRSARVIRKCQSLFNRFNKYVSFSVVSPPLDACLPACLPAWLAGVSCFLLFISTPSSRTVLQITHPGSDCHPEMNEAR